MILASMMNKMAAKKSRKEPTKARPKDLEEIVLKERV
jgi:hypothetical protein